MHGIAHAVGALFKVPHGRAIAAVMPFVLKFNRKGIEDKLVDVARYLDLSHHSFDGFMDWIIYLRLELGMPASLGELGVTKADIPKIQERAERDANMGTNPNQYGLGSFWISIANFDQYPFEVLDSTLFNFSAKPTDGIFIAAGNAAPVPFDDDFPVGDWKYKHRFTIEDFRYEPFFELNRSLLFNQAIGQVYLTIRYERLGGLDFLSETFMDEYSIIKEYRISTFMKNHIDQPE